MSFKERKIIEENYQEKINSGIDKVKGFASNNPGLTVAGLGAGVGALANYIGDGANDLEIARETELKTTGSDVRNDLAEDKYVDSGDMREFVGHVQDANDVGNHQIRDTIGDGLGRVLPWVDDNAEAQVAANSMTVKEPSFQIDANNNPVIDGYKYDNSISPDANEIAYRRSMAANPPAEFKEMVEKQVSRAEDAQKESISNSTRDSYLKKMALGAGAGAAGLFAKRKIQGR